MASRSFGEFHLHFEAPESGRYRAPILVLPGLFQSFACWRPLTSMLAHRGWEVYCLARTMPDREGEARLLDRRWEDARRRVLEVVGRLGEETLVFGADAGALLALSVVDEARVPALALFAPAAPADLARAWQRSRPLLSRWLPSRDTADGERVEAPRDWTAQAPDAHVEAEPRALLEDLATMRAPGHARAVPTVVFAPEDDPLVARHQALAFAGAAHAKASSTPLAGRFWPARSKTVADEVHRYLILTLGDRVVEFPEDVLDEDGNDG